MTKAGKDSEPLLPPVSKVLGRQRSIGSLPPFFMRPVWKTCKAR